jgi:hypothetical protein
MHRSPKMQHRAQIRQKFFEHNSGPRWSIGELSTVLERGRQGLSELVRHLMLPPEMAKRQADNVLALKA